MRNTLFLLSSFLLCFANIDSPSSKDRKFAGAICIVYYDYAGACFLEETSLPLKYATCSLAGYYKSLFKTQNPLQEIKFDQSSKCKSSLVETDNPDTLPHKVAGSSKQCLKRLYIGNYNAGILSLIKSLLAIVVLFIAFIVVNVVTFAVNRIKLNGYSKKFIFCNNLCWAFHIIGMILRAVPKYENFICLDEDVLQEKFDPKFVFYLLIFCCCMAAVYWFFFYTVARNFDFSGKGSQEFIQLMKMIFHEVAWCMITLHPKTINCNSWVSGCLVGFYNINILSVVSLLGSYFLTLSFIKVVKVMFNNEEISGRESRQNFHQKMLNRGYIALCLVMHICITFAYCNWDDGVKDYADSLAKSSVQSSLSGGESSYSGWVSKSEPSFFVSAMYIAPLHFLESYISSLILNVSYQEIFRKPYWKISCCIFLSLDVIKSIFARILLSI